MNKEDIIDWTPASMLEVVLNEPDDFLKVKETLSRIGVASQREANTLYQSCHILHKQGRYKIVHFKELFLLDGKPSTFTYDDMCRRNTIATLLADWGLLTIPNLSDVKDTCSLKSIKIISHKEKPSWDLRVKYQIGKVKGNRQ
jgi:hypothetical protein